MKLSPNNCLLILALTVAPFSARAADHFVEIYANSYAPSSLSVNSGDSVTWINQDDDFHTVTSNSGAWPSPLLDWGDSFTITFVTAGSYSYFCQLSGFTGVVHVSAANTPPSVAISNPTNNAVFNAPASFTLSATASDSNDSVASVQFLVGGTSLGTDTVAPYSVGVNNLAAGNYTLHAIATDSLGAKATNSIAIIVNGAPTVTVTSPANNTAYAAPASFTVSATASDPGGSIASVQFLLGASSLGTDTSSPYSAAANSIASGTYTLSAIATDNLGGKATNSITVFVTSPPVVSITGPTNGAVFSAPYSGTAQATATDSDGSITNVIFTLNGSTIGQDTTAPYTAPLSNLSARSHQLTVQAFDNRGISSSQSVNFRVITNAVLSGVKRVNGQFQFTASTVPSQVYLFEGSINFTNWTPLLTNTAVGNTIIFTDTQTASFTNRFYRVRSQ